MNGSFSLGPAIQPTATYNKQGWIDANPKQASKKRSGVLPVFKHVAHDVCARSPWWFQENRLLRAQRRIADEHNGVAHSSQKGAEGPQTNAKGSQTK
jgi:hypothetical protein